MKRPKIKFKKARLTCDVCKAKGPNLPLFEHPNFWLCPVCEARGNDLAPYDVPTPSPLSPSSWNPIRRLGKLLGLSK